MACILCYLNPHNPLLTLTIVLSLCIWFLLTVFLNSLLKTFIPTPLGPELKVLTLKNLSSLPKSSPSESSSSLPIENSLRNLRITWRSEIYFIDFYLVLVDVIFYMDDGFIERDLFMFSEGLRDFWRSLFGWGIGGYLEFLGGLFLFFGARVGVEVSYWRFLLVWRIF